jgi:hypothetical protein
MRGKSLPNKTVAIAGWKFESKCQPNPFNFDLSMFEDIGIGKGSNFFQACLEREGDGYAGDFLWFESGGPES